MVEHAECRACGQEVGSEYHRAFHCPLWSSLRGKCLSVDVKEWLSTGEAEDLGHALTEGHLTADVIGPPASWTGTVNSFGRPGGFQGLVFIDGSSMAPRDECLRRSGWSVIELDEHGTVVREAFGACPLELCPQQSAPEAEDYALYMLGRMCEPLGIAGLRVG
eukprot:4732714-Amphidinium_carterae.1